MKRRATSDNFVVVPASQLPFREQWRRLADELPPHNVMFVVPASEIPLKRSMRMAVDLRRRGRHIAVAACHD